MGNNERSVSANLGHKRSRLKWVAVGVGVSLLAGIGAMFLVGSQLENWTKQKVIDVAKEQGLLLEVSDAEISLNSVHLRDARASLEGVPGLTAYLQSVDITLSGLKADRIGVGGLIVQAVGTPTNLMASVRAWQSRHPSKGAKPKTEIGRAKLTWQETLDGAPFVVLDGVTFAPVSKPLATIGDDVSFRAEQAQVGAYTTAPLSAAIHVEPDAIEVGIGAQLWESMAARGGWRKQPNGDELHFSVGPLQLGPVLAANGVKLDDPTIASATAYCGISLLRTTDGAWPYQGRFAIDLVGFTPPHPPELDGFPFGKSTRLESAFRIDNALSAADLMETRITAGDFKLVGHGKISRGAALSAHLQAELKGSIPCTSLASAVAGSKLGKSYGQWLARGAQNSVAGTVDVAVQIDANTNALGQAKVAKVIGVGCGLKPLSVHQLLTLDLPPLPDMELIRHLGKDIPGAGGKLPSMPSLGLPEWKAPDWMKPH